MNDTITTPVPVSEVQLPPEIQVGTANQELVDRVRAALVHPLADTFRHCLETLVRLARNVKGRVRLWTDFAPSSFTFVVVKADGSCWINGGVIFHSAADGYGSGGAPTFSVCVSPVAGWQIHS